MERKRINIHHTWKSILHDEFDKEYFSNLQSKLDEERSEGLKLYPPESKTFHAFERTPFDQLKAVIIGQDPYHNPDQATGLSFSVPKNLKRPPSLLNIYKELNRDLGCKIPTHGDISVWADRGVLLLNAMLTVREKEPGSHRKIGWQQFTDAVISTISQRKQNIVFLLWGNFANGKKGLINENKHLVLQSAHPSPLAGNAFQGNEHFSKTNTYLRIHGIDAIDWDLEESENQLKLEL